LYGTTAYGGQYDNGTIFKITTNGALTTLYSFTGGSDGSSPVAALIQASDGNLYVRRRMVVALMAAMARYSKSPPMAR